MKTQATRAQRFDSQIVEWRLEQLTASGFPLALADGLARDDRFDLHALIELVERGCAPALAVRILAPLDAESPRLSADERGQQTDQEVNRYGSIGG
jgi:hypothetical protein